MSRRCLEVKDGRAALPHQVVVEVKVLGCYVGFTDTCAALSYSRGHLKPNNGALALASVAGAKSSAEKSMRQQTNSLHKCKQDNMYIYICIHYV